MLPDHMFSCNYASMHTVCRPSPHLNSHKLPLSAGAVRLSPVACAQDCFFNAWAKSKTPSRVVPLVSIFLFLHLAGCIERYVIL